MTLGLLCLLLHYLLSTKLLARSKAWGEVGCGAARPSCQRILLPLSYHRPPCTPPPAGLSNTHTHPSPLALWAPVTNSPTFCSPHKPSCLRAFAHAVPSAWNTLPWAAASHPSALSAQKVLYYSPTLPSGSLPELHKVTWET